MNNQKLKDHYVYLVKDQLDNVRYVGEGRGSRYKYLMHSSRTEAFRDFLKKEKYSVELMQECLSKKEALELEKNTIKELLPSGLLFNVQKSKKVVDLSYESLSKILSINLESPTKLVWNYDRIKKNGRLCSKARKGFIAGANGRKTASLGIDGVTYQVHRIVWVLFNKQNLHGDLVINHIDGNPLNNNPLNLEAVPQKENILKTVNRAKKETPVGINIRSNHGKPNQIVAASITDENGNQIFKYFSVNKYGLDSSIKLAIDWRESKLREIYPHIFNPKLIGMDKHL
jgi:predicted GIY-YIG superfamily endonuclease